jgi:hypothetical protein
MPRGKVIVIVAAAAFTMGALPARAQTFQNYGCADGSNFIVAFYPYDKRAHIQLDGRAVTLARRLTQLAQLGPRFGYFRGFWLV